MGISSGETVEFVNNVGFPHNVVFDEDNVPEGVNAESLSHEDFLNAPGETVSTKFDKAGTYGELNKLSDFGGSNCCSDPVDSEPVETFTVNPHRKTATAASNQPTRKPLHGLKPTVSDVASSGIPGKTYDDIKGQIYRGLDENKKVGYERSYKFSSKELQEEYQKKIKDSAKTISEDNKKSSKQFNRNLYNYVEHRIFF